MNRILICFIFAFLVGCHSDKQNQKETKTRADSNDFFTIDLTKAIDNNDSVQLSQVSTKIEYIQLETNSNNLIRTILDAQIGKQYVFLSTYGTVYQFTLEGHFVRKIGNLGRGPQEYSLVRSFSIDENKELVYVHSNDQKLLVFDFDGKFIEQIKFPNLGNGIIVWNQDSTFLQYSEGDFEVGGFVFTERNKHGDTIQFVRNYNGFDKMPGKVFMMEYFYRNKFYRYKNIMHFKSWYNDTIYSFDSQGQIYPKYNVDLKHFKLPEMYFYNKIRIKNPKDYYWFGIQETNRFIFINYSSYFTDQEDNPGGIAIFDKNTKESYSISNKINDQGIIDDYLDGPGFVPRYVKDSLAFNFVDAYTIKHHFTNLRSANVTLKNRELYNKMKELDDNSNPIMQIVRLKE